MRSPYISEVISLTHDLIAIPSVKESPKALGDVLSVAQKTLKGFHVETFSDQGVPSLLAYVGKTRPKKFAVILNAHLDVVPGKKDQYAPKIVGDKLIGRGAYDMKAAAAVEILLFKELAEKLNYPLGLQLVTDEEVGGHHGTLFQVNKGVDAQSVLVGETSSNLTIGIRSKGIVWAQITFHGKVAHGAYPWNGENALWKAHQFLQKIQTKFAVPKTEVWKTTMNLARIETPNNTFNKVPDEATVMLDIRYVPEDKERVKKDLESSIENGDTISYNTIEPSHETPSDNSFVTLLADAVTQITGQKAQIVGKHGGSDLRHFTDAAGLEFGPVGSGPHTDDEWVSISGLQTYADIVKTFLLSKKITL